jgi:SOS response regulatory protein OraA/RecX
VTSGCSTTRRSLARGSVESRDRARPRGERALQNELRLKGIDRSLVDAVLDERRSADGVALAPDRDAAERLIEKHARSLDRIPDPRRRRERAYALLARNGFDPETCRDVAAGVTAAEADEDPASDGPA